MPRQNQLNRLFSSPALNTAGLLLILLLLSISLVRALWRDRDLRQEEHQLQKDVVEAHAEQKRMRELIGYLKTPEYIEAEARKTYGFAKPDEQVVIFQGSAAVGKTAVVASEGNPSKWYKYFFEQNDYPKKE